MIGIKVNDEETVYFPDHAVVEFLLGDDGNVRGEIAETYEGKRVLISTGFQSLEIKPQAANSVLVKVGK